MMTPTAGTSPSPSDEGLLCVANFPANTGFAWNFIEGIFADLSRQLGPAGIRTFVAFPELRTTPATLADSPAVPVLLTVDARSIKSLSRVLAFIRAHRITVLYLTDRSILSLSYVLYRLAGVRRIVVHDHTSGTREVPRGMKRIIKALLMRLPWVTPDCVLAVSEFVAERTRLTSLLPARRIRRVWNGLPMPTAMFTGVPADVSVIAPADRPIVLCVARATPSKGLRELLEAFRELIDRCQTRDTPKPYLLYAGTGPMLDEVKALVSRLQLEADVRVLGYREDVPELLSLASVVVVPSIWEEAFGLTVLEAMRAARPIVATAVGGIPEMLRNEREGLLVPARDVVALANSIQRLLSDTELAQSLSTAARTRATQEFTDERMVNDIRQSLFGALRSASFKRVDSGTQP